MSCSHSINADQHNWRYSNCMLVKKVRSFPAKDHMTSTGQIKAGCVFSIFQEGYSRVAIRLLMLLLGCRS